jgi:hypothetical protein
MVGEEEPTTGKGKEVAEEVEVVVGKTGDVRWRGATMNWRRSMAPRAQMRKRRVVSFHHVLLLETAQEG